MKSEPTSAVSFLRSAEDDLLELAVETSRADWVHATFITDDTQALAAKANARLIASTVRWAKRSMELPTESLGPEERRKVKLLRLSLSLVTPDTPAEGEELTRLVSEMQGIYAKGRHVPVGTTEAVDLQGLSRILSESRDPVQLEDAWTGWHRVGRAIRAPFVRYVELANRGARELGFPDMGAMWRSKYDMPPDEFVAEVERLWQQVRPLYETLHAYTRMRLRATYGPDRVPERGPIPAHLLGNMWAQSWDGIYPLVGPADSSPGFDLTQILVDRHTSATEMVRYAERFFVSLGLDPLPASFWERSMLVRPRDREVVCHASAWDLDFVDDLRIKMCIEITGEDFQTIHHELGHNYYQRAYSRQPFLFRESAHDGFHEAVGDTVGLSVTPEYLVRIGLLGTAPGREPRHRAPSPARPGKGRVPSVRARRRPVAVGGLRRADHAVRVQPDVVGDDRAVSGRSAPRLLGGKRSSTPERSSTSPRTFRTCGTSSPTSSSSSSTARSPDAIGHRAPCTAPRSTVRRRPGDRLRDDARDGVPDTSGQTPSRP